MALARVSRLEGLCHRPASRPRAALIAPRGDLILRRAGSEERCHIVNKRPSFRPRRERDHRLIEEHAPRATARIQRRPWEDVLLSTVSDGSEPQAGVRRAEPCADQRLLALARVLVRRHRILLVQVGVVAPVAAELLTWRRGPARDGGDPRVQVDARFAHVERCGRAHLALSSVGRSAPLFRAVTDAHASRERASADPTQRGCR